MKTNQQFKNEALGALRGNWGRAVLLTLVIVILVCVGGGHSFYQSLQTRAFLSENATNSLTQMVQLYQSPEYLAVVQKSQGASAFSLLFYILVLAPLTVGVLNAFRRLLVQGDNDLLPNAFHIAFTNYWHKVWGMLWMGILIWLWSLLFIIPGIIKGFSYAMTPFILEENPELTATEAIHRSRMMMKGHKFDLFWLYLSFIGWILLCILTLGIGSLWLDPYIQTSVAAFYEEVKAEYAQNGGLD